MATNYFDIIKLRAGKPAYSLEEEKGDEWTSFIANEQFNGVLRTVLKSVRGNDIDYHKSFWINGTYGTGKSHAVAVITHLLCDPVDEIKSWVDYEYAAPKFDEIRNSIYSIRDSKRLLPIKVEGMKNMTHVSDLPLVIQSEVVKALNENDIELAVDTDFDTLIAHIEKNDVIWDNLIERDNGLAQIVASRKLLMQRLMSKDLATFQRAKAALRNAQISIILELDTLGTWLIEVQEQLRQQGVFQGLLILWDEFTDVMNDSIGIPVLKELQTVAHKFANDENDSYVFLISHPSAFNNLGSEATKQTDGRYHRMKYNMESVSAFKIMSRKLEIVDTERHSNLCKLFYAANEQLLDIYTATSNDQQETRSDLQNLFPLHPGTANLATHYATVVGSSSRSVFEFLGQNDAIKNFLGNEDLYNNRATITVDYLWDFVLKIFQDDVTNYGAVTERYNTYRAHAEERGEAAFAIFKGVLLLNAFNNISAENNNDLVTPSRVNIENLFTGTSYETEVDDVMSWFNEQGVIQRTPNDIFSVQFSALPSHEIEEIKETLRSGDYCFASQILRFGDVARTIFDRKYLQKVIRPYSFEFYSEDKNNSLLKNKIKSAKKATRSSSLFLSLLFAKNNAELTAMRQMAEEASNASNEDKELRDIAFIVFDTTFGDKNYNLFIEYMANYTSASNHGFVDQVNVHRGHAFDMIKEWLQNAQRGNATIYVNGESLPLSIKHLSSSLNTLVAPIIFPQGPDALEALRTKAPSTFWKPQVSKEIIRTFIFATTKSELLDVNGVMKPVQWLIQDAIDDNLEWKQDIPEAHQLKATYDFIQKKIKYADKSQLFNFAEKFEDLTKPPYGLAGNYASAAIVAFAMRPWVNKIFDQVGKPRDANNLTEDIAELFNVWEKGKSSNKLSFKFQTPEEGKLCKALVSVLRLNKLQGYSDVSSMKDARYAITGVLLEQQNYPLWSLKYMTDSFVSSHPAITLNDNIRTLFDNIVAICADSDLKNPALINSTLELIDRFKVDVPDIISKPGVFKNGFEQYLLDQPIVNLQDEEIEDAYVYIQQHLEATVGYWTEDEVAIKLKDWRMEKNGEIERVRQEQDEAERQRLNEEAIAQIREQQEQAFKGDPEKTSKKKASAREYIDSIDNLEDLRSLLDKIINLGYERILDEILDTNK